MLTKSEKLTTTLSEVSVLKAIDSLMAFQVITSAFLALFPTLIRWTFEESAPNTHIIADNVTTHVNVGIKEALSLASDARMVRHHRLCGLRACIVNPFFLL
jgi:hypothetical protein